MPYNDHSEENLQGLLAMGANTANPQNEKVMVRGDINNGQGSPVNFDRDVSPKSPTAVAPERSPGAQVKDQQINELAEMVKELLREQ